MLNLIMLWSPLISGPAIVLYEPTLVYYIGPSNISLMCAVEPTAIKIIVWKVKKFSL